MLSIIRYRTPLYSSLLLCAVIAGITYYFTMHAHGSNAARADSSVALLSPEATGQVQVKRLEGYKFIKPVMFVETLQKSERYAPLTKKISDYIATKKQMGEIADAAFYFRDIDNTAWTGYNEDIPYLPGSLMKVPELISVLRMEEDKPGTLQKQVFYAAPFLVDKNPEFVSKQLQPGRKYSMRELLGYMITYSDNNATILLDENLDQRIFNKMLTDLGLSQPVAGAVNYPISAKDFSLFMRAIYNASYLTIAHSEYAAALLSTSKFKEGFAKGFPANIKMIHKFGEAGNASEHQLHESGIVYVNDKPYILAVMTKGKDLPKLTSILADIATMVYEQVQAL